MRAVVSLRKFIPRGSLGRGDAYYAQGRVRRIEAVSSGIIEAQVQGSRLYSVTLAIDGARLESRCDCPWFETNLAECKHVWAAIRAADATGLLPDRELVPHFGRARDQRPQWQRFLESLGTGHHRSRDFEPKKPPEEIAYVVVRMPNSNSLTLQISGRSRKKSGEWGKWKQLSMRLDEINALPPFDRESIALLHQRSWDTMVESTIYIDAVATAWWVERLARAGRLALRTSDDEPRPIAWDDGPPWKFRVAVVSDAKKSQYRLEGSVARDGESLPLDVIDAVVNDILFAGDHAARFDDGGQAQWLQALRASGPIVIPHADAERFRTALLRAPIANIALPEELGWTLVDAEPRPLLSLMHDGWSSELQAELLFQYDEWRVSNRSAELQKTIGRKLIRRERERELLFDARLTSLGAITAWPGFRIRLQHLEPIVRTLIREGWSIEIDAAPVRVADAIEAEVSSGIDWFDLNIHANFGDVRVPLPELLTSVETKRSLLRLADGSYGIVPSAWSEDLAPVIELGKREGDGLRFRSAQALLVDSLLKSKAKADKPFTELRERMIAAAPKPRQEPKTLATTLRPYQRAGLGWFHFLRDAGLGGCLADDMGLGKTVQALALLEELRVSGNTRPSLVVAPRSLLFNWIAEAKRFAPKLRVVEHHGAARANNVLTDCDIVLTTYATMRLDIDRLSEIDFEYAILDEAQAIKNATSAAAKATRQLRARHRLALSGTPIENHLGELWSLFEFLNPGLLGSSRSFARTFASKTAPPERREALARAVRPLILRRTKEQVAPELPERIEQTLYCELEGKQKKQYDDLRDHYRHALLNRVRKGGIEKSRMQILEALLRLRQAACDPALIDRDSDANSAKVELLMDELREVVESGHRALVFSQFTSFLDIVRGALDVENVEYLYLDGKTRDRQSLVQKFQSDDGPPLFLISLKAGGLGLNLTNADYIFLLDPWWNPAVEAQAIDRAHRIGRSKPVVAYRLIARDTVEEKILELQAKKRELAESIISEDNSVLRKLEVEDLELLLA